MSPASPASVISPIAREHGQVDAHNPSVLKEAGNDAMRARDWKRGMHMFTVGIDMITNSSPPSDAAGWFALDVKSKGVLHLLCSNRSLAHLNLGDTSAAIQDAEACCQARPGFAKGHQRLLAALAAAGAPLEERREACARGRRACPNSAELRDAQAELDAEAGVEPEEAIGAAEVRVRVRARARARAKPNPSPKPKPNPNPNPRRRRSRRSSPRRGSSRTTLRTASAPSPPGTWAAPSPWAPTPRGQGPLAEAEMC